MAVLAVLLYHAFPGALPGGFIGVDVFFVISGFLISRNIGADLKDHRFSFADFYARRIRRLFPALLIVLASCYAIGWAYFLTFELTQLGKHTAAGASFVSNLVFYAEAGYFDMAREQKVLQHLWSLSIEEQYYVVWPALLWLAWMTRRAWTSILIVAGVLSFAWCVAVTFQDESAAFFLPFGRVWEFVFGAWLGLSGIPRWRGASWQRDVAVGLGLFAIIATTLVAIDLRQFPGFWALVPVIATTLIIAGGPEALPSRALLTHPIAVWVGLISYPLYLWHWPLLTFARILLDPPVSPGLRAAVLALSVVLAWLTFRFIERPLRRPQHAARTTAGLIAGMTAIAAVGYVTYASDGLPTRRVAEAARPYVASLQSTYLYSPCFDLTNDLAQDRWLCHLNPSGRMARVMVVGDSHARAIMPAFERVAIDRGEDVVLAAQVACPPLVGIALEGRDRDTRNCQQLNDRVLRYVTEHRISDVFLVGGWTYYTDGDYRGLNYQLLTTGASPRNFAGSRAAFERGLDDTIARYRAVGATLHIVQKVPTQLRTATELIRSIVTAGGDPAAAIRSVSVPRPDHRRLIAYLSEAFARHGIRPDVQQPVSLVDLESAYCDAEVCPFAEPNASYYFDAGHLSLIGARRAAPLIAERFAAIDARLKP